MNHEIKTGDISGNPYISIRHEGYPMFFLLANSGDERVVIANPTTLANTPHSVLRSAERYLENQGYTVI